MNRKAKIIATLSTLGLAIAMLVFSVYAATTVTFKVTTNVSFTATKHVKATVTARDSGATATVLTADASLYPNKAKTGADQTIGVNPDGTDNGKIEDVEFNPAQLTATDKYYGYQITITNNDEQNDLPVYIKTNAQTGEGYKVTFTNATDSTIKYNVPYIITCIIQVTDLAGNTVTINNNDLALNINLGEKEPTNEYLKYTFKNETVDHYSVAIDETALNDSFDGEIIIPAKYNDGTNNVQVVKNITALHGSSTDLAEVTSVTLPNTIETIEAYAFKNASIENIILPASVTSVGLSAFSGVSGDIYVDKTEAETQSWDTKWTNGHTGNVYYKDEWSIVDGEPVAPTLDYLTFTLSDSGDYYIVAGNKSKMKSSSFDGKIVIPEIYEGIPVKIIDEKAFSGCTKLTEIKILNGVTTIRDSAFYSCTNLTTIEIPDSVTALEKEAFYNCTSLTEIELPNSVTTIEYYAFNNCTSLTTIEISDSLAIIVGGAFNNTAWYNNQPDGAIYLGKVLYDYKGTMTDNDKNFIVREGTVSISSGAFNNCTSLTTIDFPNSLTTIGDSAFYYCESLTSIDFPNSLTAIGSNAFNGCKNLTTIEFPNSVTTIGYNAFYNTAWYNNQPDGAIYINNVLYSYKGTMTNNDKNFIVREGTVSISGSAFYGCKNLTTISIPNSVTSIGIGAFQSCTSLTEIEIPNSVTTIGSGAFSGCSGLTAIEIPNSVTIIGNQAFQSCTSLTTIELSEGLATIGDNAFNYCYQLAEVINKSNLDITAGSLEYGYVGCFALVVHKGDESLIEVINEVKYINYDNKVYAVGPTDKNCTNITIKVGTTDIRQYAFYGCKSLTTIVIPSGVKTMGYMAFYGCKSLTTIVIPSSVKTMGYRAFYECIRLTIYCEVASVPTEWDYDWNSSNRPVYWAGQWSYVNGVPTPNNA